MHRNRVFQKQTPLHPFSKYSILNIYLGIEKSILFANFPTLSSVPKELAHNSLFFSPLKFTVLDNAMTYAKPSMVILEA